MLLIEHNWCRKSRERGTTLWRDGISGEEHRAGWGEQEAQLLRGLSLHRAEGEPIKQGKGRQGNDRGPWRGAGRESRKQVGLHIESSESFELSWLDPQSSWNVHLETPREWVGWDKVKNGFHYSALQKQRDCTVGDNMGGPPGCYTKWKKSVREINTTWSLSHVESKARQQQQQNPQKTNS